MDVQDIASPARLEVRNRVYAFTGYTMTDKGIAACSPGQRVEGAATVERVVAAIADKEIREVVASKRVDEIIADAVLGAAGEREILNIPKHGLTVGMEVKGDRTLHRVSAAAAAFVHDVLGIVHDVEIIT